MTTTSRESLRELLARAPMFERLESAVLAELADACEIVQARGGSTLVASGQPLGAVYGVVHGALRLVRRGHEERIVRELYRGELIGAMTVFDDAPVSLGLVVLRDSTLLRIGRDALIELAQRHRAFLLALARVLSGHTRELLEMVYGPSERAASGGNVALVPVDRGSDEVTRQLASLLGREDHSVHVTAAMVDAALRPGAADSDDPRVTAMLSDLEGEARFVVYQCEHGRRTWTERCLRQSDRLVVIASPGSEGMIDVLASSIARARERPGASDRSRARAPGRRAPARHAPLVAAPRRLAHAPRALRRAARSRARHAAPLGSPDRRRALRRGRARDRAPRCARGAGRGGHRHRLRVRHQHGRDLRGRRGARLDHRGDARRGARPLRQAVRALRFGLAHLVALGREEARQGAARAPRRRRDRGSADPVLLRLDRVSRAPRSSCTTAAACGRACARRVPSLAFSPRSRSRGALVDGGLMDNLPVDLLAERCPGTLIAVDVFPYGDPTFTAPAGAIARRLRALRSRIEGAPASPPLFDILMRSTLVGSKFRQETAVARLRDVRVLEPPVSSFGILQWRAHRALFDAGYHYAREQIARWPRP